MPSAVESAILYHGYRNLGFVEELRDWISWQTN